MRSVIFACCGFLTTLSVSPGIAMGQISGIRVEKPANEPFWPGPKQYTPLFVNSVYGVSSLKWEMKCLMANATNPNYTVLYPATDTSPTSINANHYGAHRIKCTATYTAMQGVPGPPPAPTFVEIDIDVVLPNKTKITAGLGVPFHHSMSKKAIAFTVQRDDKPFPYLMGWPQEKVTIFFPYQDVVGYVPLTQAELDQTKYYLNVNDIVDYKSGTIKDADWALININDVWLKYDQVNRMVYTNCAGVTSYAVLSTHTIHYIKVDNTQMKMVEP